MVKSIKSLRSRRPAKARTKARNKAATKPAAKPAAKPAPAARARAKSSVPKQSAAPRQKPAARPAPKRNPVAPAPALRRRKPAPPAAKSPVGAEPRRAKSALPAPGKWVYAFGDGKAEGRARLRDLLGGKGANLAEMANLGLPVPPGFTITTEVCTYFYRHGKTYPDELKSQVDAALGEVGKIAGRWFGDRRVGFWWFFVGCAFA